MGWFNCEKKLLLAIIFIALAARVFALFFFPDAALNDGILHLELAKGLLDGKEIAAIFLPPPLQHFALASFYSFSGLEWSGILLKAIPFALSLAFLFACLSLFRKVFPKKYLLPFAFVAANPWLITYFSINYTEAFAITSMAFAALFCWRFFERPGNANLALFGLFTGILAVSKLNATFVAVAIVLAVLAVFAFFQKKLFGKWVSAAKSAALFCVSSAVFPVAWFVSEYFRHGYFILPNVSENFFAYPAQALSNPFLMVFKSLFLSVVEFWGYPSVSIAAGAFPSSVLAVSYAVFFLVVFLLSLAVVAGFFLLLKKARESMFFFVVFAAIAAELLFIVAHGTPFFAGDSLYWRYFLPALPLVAIPFALGADFLAGKAKTLHRPLLACFAVFALFSIAYSGYFAFHFFQSHGSYDELYSYLDTLPYGSGVFTADLGRQITFFSETPVCSASTWDSDLSRDPKAIVFHSSPEESARILLEGGCTHIAVTSYYREAWKPEKIEEMVFAGAFEKVFEQESFTIYRVIPIQ